LENQTQTELGPQRDAVWVYAEVGLQKNIITDAAYAGREGSGFFFVRVQIAQMWMLNISVFINFARNRKLCRKLMLYT
jgi:hypothetical protein